MDITPKPLTSEEKARFDLDDRLEEKCLKALGDARELDEFDEIAMAKEIVAAFAAEGVKMPISRSRGRLLRIIRQRQDSAV